MMDDLSGKTIRGYELRQHIGAGGFGTVYRAYQPVVQREVAVKIILPERASQPEFIRRFEAEAQFVARLEHIHIVPLYDYWRDPEGAYLVMRWLRGGNLQEALRRGPWNLSHIARLIDQIASALAVAHRNGVIHRDLKPANILLDEEGNAFLGDFGIAKDILLNPDVSPEDGFFGSPGYVSPERILGDPVSPRSDIYSLGVVLFELLTSQVPFDGATDGEILSQHVSQPLPALTDFRPDLPAALDMVLRRATAKDPHSRYANAFNLAEDFHAIAATIERVGAATGYQPLDDADKVATRQLAAVQAATGEIRTAQLDAQILPSPLEPRNPFKGLRPFEEADAADFFGRDSLIQHLLNRLQKATSHFIAVVGPSGGGKSSLVKAGVIPALRQGALPGSSHWLFAQMAPGTHPLHELEEAISRVAVTSLANLADGMLRNTYTLPGVMEQILPETSELLLVIDQFEELFTLTGNEKERACFLDNLVSAVTISDSRLRLIITLRADFYDRPLLYPDFGELVRQYTEVILPLTADELRDAILAPASRSGLEVEPALVDAMVVDVLEQPGALPLLQYALTELFERRADHTLSLDGYERIGGVSGALARRAEDLYQSLDAAHRETVRQIFLRLVTPGEGSEDTRRRVLQPELVTIPHCQDMLRLFSTHRLLTFDHEPATRTPTVELAHEALIREWKQLQQWVDTNREALQIQRRLSLETSEWITAGRAPGFLATGARLAQFEGLFEAAALALNEDERAYLSASIALQRRTENRLRLFIVALIVFSVVALGFALFAFDRQQNADAERIRADFEAALAHSRELAVTALTSIDKQLDLSLLLSVEAFRAADTFEARNSLLSGLQAQPNLISILQDRAGAVRTVAIDPRGRWLASGGTGNTIVLWDLKTHQMIGQPLAGHSGSINGLAFSSDGKVLASASEDGTIRLWNPSTGSAVGQPLEGHADAVWVVRFNPKGNLLASGSADQTIRLWDSATGQPVGEPLTGHSDIVFALAFDPTGQRLASGGDETVRLWDVAAQEEIGEPFIGHTDWVLSLAFSADGTVLASGSADNTVRLWDAQSGATLGEPLTDHSGWVRSLALSPDGQLLASGSGDGTIHLHDFNNGHSLVLSGHQDEVWSIAFTPDGTTLVSASEDQTLRLWAVQAQAGVGQLVAHQSQTVSGLALSPDGQWLASASGDPQANEHPIHVWDVATGREQMTLAGHQQAVTDVAFSPDGQLLASGGADDMVRLWNLETGQPILESLLGHQSAVTGIAFSPDGTQVVSASQDRTIRFWDVTTGDPIGDPLTGHQDWVTSLAFDPTGKVFASGSADAAIILWDVETRIPIGEPLNGHTDEITRLAFSPDGRQLASASRDSTVRLWDVTTQETIGQPFVGHLNWILDVAFKPDEPLLATSSRDQTAILWDLNTGLPIGQPFFGSEGWVNRVVFSADGRFVWSGDQAGNIIRWPTAVDLWRDHACRIANRNLTLQEWQRYLREEPYQKTCLAFE